MSISPASAQNATWLVNPTVAGPVGGTFDFNANANWNPTTAPGSVTATGTAIFGASNGTNISFSSVNPLAGIVVLDGFTFTAGASNYTFTNASGLTFNGAGILINGGSASIANNSGGMLEFFNASTAGSASITNSIGGITEFFNTSTAGTAAITNNGLFSFNGASTAGRATITNSSGILFNSTSSAGSANIINNGGAIIFSNASTAANAGIMNGGSIGFINASTAGSATIANNGGISFSNRSTAGNANITNLGGGIIFQNNSTAGNATIANSSLVQFSNNSTGGNARLINNTSTAAVDFSGSTGPNNDGKLSAGSIEGVGDFFLGANQLTVGGNNLSTAVSGVISDCGNPAPACVQTNATGGSLVKAGAGTLTLSGVNTYSGGTIVNGGTLALSGVGTLGATTASTTVNGGGTLDLGGTTQTQASLLLAGGVLQNGSLNAPITSTGGVINNIGGTASLTTTGGATIVSGSNGFTGATVVNGGTLEVDGAVTGTASVTVNSGGTLLGIGTVGPTLAVAVENGAVLRPGNAANPTGTFSIAGNLTFQNVTATYLIGIDGASAAKTVVTGGSATLNGASVGITSGSSIAGNTKYTILSASGGVIGTFNPAVTFGIINGTLGYDANDVFLTFSGAAVPRGLNVNQHNVASSLTAFFDNGGALPPAFLNVLGGNNLPNALTQLSGETATGVQQTTFNAMGQFMGLLTDPFMSRSGGITNAPGAMAYAPEGPPDADAGKKTGAFAVLNNAQPIFEQRWSVWAAAYGGAQSTNGNAVVGSNTATSNIVGTAVGADYLLSPNTLLGFALAGGGTSFSVANGGTGRSDLFQVGAYLRHTDGPAYVAAAFAYGWQDITTNRTVTLAGLDQLRAEFKANAYSARLEGGYRFVSQFFGGIGITPYAATQFVAFDLPAYAEQAIAGSSNFALAYGAHDIADERSELGFRTDRSWALDDGVLTLRGRFAWAHDFAPDRAIAATFQSLPGASFVVNGAAQAADSALTTASVEIRWKNGWSAATTFEGEFASVSQSYAGKGVVRYQW